MVRCCAPGQGVQLEPRWSAEGWGYAAWRNVEQRAPRGRYPGACGEAAAGDGWEARLEAIWGWLVTVLPSDVDFKIAPWFARGGRVMFVLTARVAIAPLRQRAAGGKSHGGAVVGKSHGGRASRARRAAERAAKRSAERAAGPAPACAPADARTEELMVPSPVADAATESAHDAAGAVMADAGGPAAVEGGRQLPTDSLNMWPGNLRAARCYTCTHPEAKRRCQFRQAGKVTI
ncbi:hypothetical protein T492DRAFT_862236 [Pavlovales sp. CCMP2436]|nr:hypothetical protein T492DRAFT_862236 [Pavlovales sp. CCMP2436]